uniref:Uncharacterized protein n=1 Tax=Lepeophtheirus salmonis TaxID=72036 RepID=A0A0K2U7B2_LEPSM
MGRILGNKKDILMPQEVAADKFNLSGGPALHLYNLWVRVYYRLKGSHNSNVWIQSQDHKILLQTVN